MQIYSRQNWLYQMVIQYFCHACTEFLSNDLNARMLHALVESCREVNKSHAAHAEGVRLPRLPLIIDMYDLYLLLDHTGVLGKPLL